MASHDRIEAPALRACPARAELAEFARRVPHLDFSLARQRAIADALLRAASVDPDSSAGHHPGNVPPARESSR